MLKVLELFGGIGACTKALERMKIPHQVVDYVEIDKYAVASYNAIHGTDFKPQDICQWDKDISVDLIMHGSPCQDFSIAGVQAGGDENSGTRSSLMYESVRIISKLHPRYVIWENVKNVLSPKHRHNFDKYLDALSQMGYKNHHQVLNAKDYGVPQNRERVFVVSVLGDEKFEFPEKMYLKLRLKDILQDKVDEKFFLSADMTKKVQSTLKNKDTLMLDLCQWRREGSPREYNETAPTLSARDYKEPRCVQVGQMYGTEREPNPQAGSIYDSEGLSPTLDTCTGGNRMPKVMYIGNINPSGRGMNGTVVDSNGLARTVTIEKGEGQKVIVKTATKKGYDEAFDGDSINLQYPNSTTRRGLVGKQVSQTLTTTHAMNVVTSDYRIRKLTPLECWRLMGFDDEDFYKAEKVNSNTQLYKQAGNSIVVNVLEYIFKKLLEEDMKKIEEKKTIKFQTDKMINLAALLEKEPELFEDLVRDYPCEPATYIFEVMQSA